MTAATEIKSSNSFLSTSGSFTLSSGGSSDGGNHRELGENSDSKAGLKTTSASTSASTDEMKCPLPEGTIGCDPFFALKAEAASCGFRDLQPCSGDEDSSDINRCVSGCTMYHRQFYGFVEKAIRMAVAKYRFERAKELIKNPT